MKSNLKTFLYFSIFVISVQPAWADMELPMIAEIWPLSWLFFFLIVPLEALIARWIIKISWKRCLIIATLANLASTILGIPVTWFMLSRVVHLFFRIVHIVATEPLEPFMNVIWQALASWKEEDSSEMSWIFPPHPGEGVWIFPTAAAFLCVPFYFMSVFSEYLVARTLCKKEEKRAALKWAWVANFASYSLLILFCTYNAFNAIQAHNQLKQGYLDKTGSLIIHMSANYLGDFHEGLAAINKHDLWGFIDKTGKWVIKPHFISVGYLEKLIPRQKNGLWGYVNKRDDWIIQPEFSSEDALEKACSSPFDISGFHDGLSPVLVNSKWGFIDHQGSFVIKPQFDFTLGFHEEIAAVKIGSKWGYINTKGEMVVAPQFNTAHSFSEGLAIISSIDNHDQKHIACIDKTGKVVFKSNFYGIHDFSCGLARVNVKGKMKYDVDEKNGYIDRTGRVVIEPQIIGAYDFSEDLALVRAWPNKKQISYFIDKNGHKAIIMDPNKYAAIESFSEGRASVVSQSSSFSGSGFIDKTGRITTDPQFCTVNAFSDGLALTNCGYIDKNGQIVIRLDQSHYYYHPFSEGLAAVGNHWSIDP